MFPLTLSIINQKIDIMGTVLLIFIGLAVLLGLYFMITYNKLVTLRTKVAEAWSSIEVMLKKRHDLIPNLVEIVKGYASHERQTLDSVTQARTQAASAQTVQEHQQAESNLNRAMMNLFAVAEQYPDLKANTNFLSLQSDLTDLESDIEKSRRYYNGTVRDNNIVIDSFPSNMVSAMFNFVKSEFFELKDKSETAVPNIKF